jgi:hypothetical protein
LHPIGGPFEVLAAGYRVVVRAIADAEVIRWRRHHNVYRSFIKPTQYIEAIAEVEAKRCAAGFEAGVRAERSGHHGDCTVAGAQA